MLTRVYHGNPIRQREDGYLSLTDMSQAAAAVAEREMRPAPVRLDNWLARPHTKAYLAELERTLDPRVRPIEAERGGALAGGCTWAHPQVAHLYAIDIHPVFAVQVTAWVEDIRVKGYAVDARRPMDFAAIVRDRSALSALSLELARVVEEQAAQLTAAAPKIEAHDRLMNAEGEIGLQDLGRALGRRPNLFIKTLVEDGYLFRDGKTLLPAAEYADRGWFRVITMTSVAADGAPRVRQQTLVTGRGVIYFQSIYPRTNASGSVSMVSASYVMRKAGH